MPIHPVLARELRQSKRLQKFSLPCPNPRATRSTVRSTKVKREEAHLRRTQHLAEYLMEAMEAELDPPPLMMAAFTRNPKARHGWKASTP